jgi:hypothetical protein
MSHFKRFIHFGCWNHSGCDAGSDVDVKPTDTALTRVMKQIKKNITSSKFQPEFMIIAGDNYYPIIKKDKVTKVKTKLLDEDDLLSGFECLPKGLKKYLLLGNHDLEKLSNRAPAPSASASAPSACQILDMQKELEAEPTNNFEMDDLKSPFIMNTKLSDSTIIIMLDTSMYSNEDKSLKKVEHCYQRLFELHGLDNPNGDTIKNVRELQKKRVEAFVDTLDEGRLKNIIVIGHHPLVCFKTDEVKDTVTGVKTKETETLVMNELNHIYFNSIYSKLKKNKRINYFYLCADLHQYQEGDIHMANSTDEVLVKQYVAGTGGSQLEDLDVDLSLLKPGQEITKLDTLTLAYTNVYNKATYGFLDCLLTPEDDFNPLFVEADMSNFNVKTFKGGYYSKGNNKFLNKTQRRMVNKSRAKHSKKRKSTKKVKRKSIKKYKKV